MKSILGVLVLAFTVSAFAKDPYTVKKSPWGGENEVTLTGVTGDLFATHELLASKGPAWKKNAESFIEDKTDASEIFSKIEDGTISESCHVDWEKIDYIEPNSLTFKWKALKPVRKPNASTLLYVVETSGAYIIKTTNGKSIPCNYSISGYVFLNDSARKYLGKIAE